MVPTVLYPSNDTDDQLSTYAESSIWQHARYHEHLLLRLGALDYAPAQLRESLARLEHLQLCSNDCQTSDRVSHDGNGIQSHLGQPTASGSSSRSASARRSSSSSAPPPRKPPGLLARAVKKGKGKGKARLGDEQVPDYKCSYSKEDRALQGARIETEEIARSLPGLERLAKEHEDIQRELDALYESVFAGPTPGFPEEDEAELEVFAMEKRLKEDEACFADTYRTVDALKVCAMQALYALKALEAIKVPMHSSALAHKFSVDLTTKDSIARALEHANKVSQQYKAARTYDEEVSDDIRLPPLASLLQKIRAKEKRLNEDLAVQIPAARECMKEAAETLYREQQKAKQRIILRENRLKDTVKRLRHAKHFLDSTRRTIFLDLTASRRNSLEGSVPPSLSHTPDSGSDAEEAILTPSLSVRTGARARNARTDDLLELLTEDLPAYLPRTKLYPELIA